MRSLRLTGFLVGFALAALLAEVLGADPLISLIIGVAGVLTRRNIIVIFMSIELILNAANLNFIAFSRYLQEQGSLNAVAGQVFTVFIIAETDPRHPKSE